MQAQFSTELEQACRELCPHCREAKRWVDSKKKGHILRKRDDSNEWVHDFVTPIAKDGLHVDHRFCQATKLRISVNG